MWRNLPQTKCNPSLIFRLYYQSHNTYTAPYYHTPSSSGIYTETTISEEALGGSELYNSLSVSNSPLSYQLKSSEKYLSQPRLLTPPIDPTANRLHKSFECRVQERGYSSMPYLYPSEGYETSYYTNSYWEDPYYYSKIQREVKTTGDVSKLSFNINLYDILNKKDTSTTIMVKNIPNKYTQDMLLRKINKEFKDQYDFFYLPIDFKNKCNVGYAFINFVNSLYILQFFESFNGKKWEKFKSEKICQLTYARIQGRQALMLHFKSYNNLFQYSQKVRPLILPEKKLTAAEILQYEKKIRGIMTEEKVRELIEINESIFGKS